MSHKLKLLTFMFVVKCIIIFPLFSLTQRLLIDNFIPNVVLCHSFFRLECGTSSIVDDLISPLIAYGNKAVLGARPYHASLRRNNELHCGCTLIGGQWALTASHCVEYK